MPDTAPVVLLVPIAPAATGNGLAMRAGMLLDALAPVAPVHVVVVPVSSPTDDCSWARARARTVTVVEPVGPDAAREHTTRQLADPELRARLARTAPLPARAALAPPTLASDVAGALPDDASGPAAAVLVMRLYLAPLGIRLARALGATRTVIDADDDDGALLRDLSDGSKADAYDRLARCWLPDADTVIAASPVDAAALSARLGLGAVGVVPNAVAVPATVPPPPGADRLLFLGNLTYPPNRAAARLLAAEILPVVRRRRPDATLDLVGRHAGMLDDLARISGVRVTGAVSDVTPSYAAADVVVVALRHGGGTRIKVLEAFAHRRPVVATPTAVAGLDVEHEREVLIAESCDAMARAVHELLRDPAGAAAMIERAAHLVNTRYRSDVIAPLVRAAVLGPRARDRPGGSAAA